MGWQPLSVSVKASKWGIENLWVMAGLNKSLNNDSCYYCCTIIIFVYNFCYTKDWWLSLSCRVQNTSPFRLSSLVHAVYFPLEVCSGCFLLSPADRKISSIRYLSKAVIGFSCVCYIMEFPCSKPKQACPAAPSNNSKRCTLNSQYGHISFTATFIHYHRTKVKLAASNVVTRKAARWRDKERTI